MARLLVRDAHEHRVVLEQRIAREVHLRDEALHEALPEKREMDVRGAPGVVVVAPWVLARADRHEAVVAVLVREEAPGTGEIRIDRRVVLVDTMVVASGG